MEVMKGRVSDLEKKVFRAHQKELALDLEVWTTPF